MRKIFEGLCNSELDLLITENINNEIYRKIMKNYLIDGLTQKELACKYNYSTRQIANIIKKSADILNRAIAKKIA